MGGYSNVNRQGTRMMRCPSNLQMLPPTQAPPLASLPETPVLTTSVFPMRHFLLVAAVPEPIGRFPVLLYAQALCLA